MPGLQFSVVQLGWLVLGDGCGLSETVGVVALLQACVEQGLQVACHILV